MAIGSVAMFGSKLTATKHTHFEMAHAGAYHWINGGPHRRNRYQKRQQTRG